MTPDERKQQEQRLLDLRRRKQKKLQSQPEGGLFHFIEYFWDVLEPNTPLVDGWALRGRHLPSLGIDLRHNDREGIARRQRG